MRAALLLAAAAAAAVVSGANGASYAPSDKCRADGERCAGAEGHDRVEWIPCCSGGCNAVKKGQWGYFCGKPGYGGGDLYQPGERCEGAPGKEYVPWKGCAGGECSAVKYGEWGKFCSGEPTRGGGPKVEPTVGGGAQPTEGKVDGYCYPPGYRNEGASGKPYVEWKPCCSGASVQAPDWGRWCPAASDYQPPAKPTAAPLGYKPTAAPTEYGPVEPTKGPAEYKNAHVADSCYPNGYRCEGAYGHDFVEWKPCCGGQCVAANDWGKVCAGSGGYEDTPPPPTYAPSAPPAPPYVPPYGATGAPKTLPACYATNSCGGGDGTPAKSPAGPPVATPAPAPGTPLPATPAPAPGIPLPATPAPAPGTPLPGTAAPTATTTAAPPLRVSSGVTTTPATTRTTTRATTAAGGCEGLSGRPRPDAQTIPQSEWDLFEQGVKALRAKPSTRPGSGGRSVYEDFAQIHSDYALHVGAGFLMWHRVMLWEFEKELNVAVPGARIPVFDWSQYSGNLFSSTVFSAGRMGTTLESGRFPGWTSRGRTVVRDVDSTVSLHSRTLIDAGINVVRDYSSFNTWLEGVHNNFHVAMGGDMLDLSLSPNDPIFYLHHAFIDRVWREWQQRTGGNSFNGVQSVREPGRADRAETMTRSSVMLPWGRTAGSVFDGISGCVSYRNGNGFILNREVVMGEAVEREIATPVIAKSEKDGYQLVVAEEKEQNPEVYIEKVKQADDLVKATVEACKKVGFTGEYLVAWQKIEGLVQLAAGVDLADVDAVDMPAAEVAAEGKVEIAAIQAGDDSMLKDSKKDDAGAKSATAVAVAAA